MCPSITVGMKLVNIISIAQQIRYHGHIDSS